MPHRGLSCGCPPPHVQTVRLHTYRTLLRVRLNDLLKIRGMSQRELARRTEKHPDVISRFAREDTTMVSYDLLECICSALECEVSDLLEYVPDPDEQITLFEGSQEDSASTETVYRQQQPTALRAAERQPLYGNGGERA